MKKDIRNKLKHLASKLPKRSYIAREQVEISGNDLLLSGTKTVEGKKVDAFKTYWMGSPVYYESNHFLRIKKAFNRSGIDGVINYFTPFAKEPKELAKQIKQYLS